MMKKIEFLILNVSPRARGGLIFGFCEMRSSKIGNRKPKIPLCSLLFAISYLILLSSGAGAAFTEKAGVRPMGMGGAFVALADDASAITFNPAGLGQMDRTELAATYDRLYAGLGDDNLGRGSISLVHPSQGYGAFALNLALLNTPLYRETTATVGYGRGFGRLYLGLNAKALIASFEENEYTRVDPLFNNDNYNSTSIALDIGLLHKLTNNISFGLAVLNVNQPDMSLDKDADAKVPLTLQTGLALKFGSVAPTMDLTYRNKKLGDKKDIGFHLGLESWLKDNNIALRAGANLYDMAIGASYVFNCGKSLDAQIDYAFQYPLFFKEDAISDMYGTHRFSLNVRFGDFPASTPGPSQEGSAGGEVSVEELIKKAMEFKEKGEYEEGVELCDKVLKMGSQALKKLEQTRDFAPREDALKYRLDANILMGGMLTQLGQYTEAFTYLNEAMKIAPKDPRTHYELGLSYKRYGDRTGNKSWYNKAIIEFESVRMSSSEFKDVSSQLEELYKKI